MRRIKQDAIVDRRRFLHWGWSLPFLVAGAGTVKARRGRGRNHDEREHSSSSDRNRYERRDYRSPQYDRQNPSSSNPPPPRDFRSSPSGPGPAPANPGSSNSNSQPRDYDRARKAYETGQIKSLLEILGQIRQQFPGDVIDIDSQDKDGIWVYQIKIIDKRGRLLEIQVNATTKKIMRILGQ